MSALSVGVADLRVWAGATLTVAPIGTTRTRPTLRRADVHALTLLASPPRTLTHEDPVRLLALFDCVVGAAPLGPRASTRGRVRHAALAADSQQHEQTEANEAEIYLG